jgi:hypothetical protein
MHSPADKDAASWRKSLPQHMCLTTSQMSVAGKDDELLAHDNIVLCEQDPEHPPLELLLSVPYDKPGDRS